MLDSASSIAVFYVCMLYFIHVDIITCPNQYTTIEADAVIMCYFTFIPKMTGAQVSNSFSSTMMAWGQYRRQELSWLSYQIFAWKSLMAIVVYMTVGCQLQLIFSPMLTVVVRQENANSRAWWVILLRYVVSQHRYKYHHTFLSNSTTLLVDLQLQLLQISKVLATS